MKKPLRVLLGVAVFFAAIAAASVSAGRAVTSRMSEQTARVTKAVPSLSLQETLTQGVFRSTRTLRLRLGCLPTPAPDGKGIQPSAPIELEWRDTIHHGPFPGATAFGVASIDSVLITPRGLVQQLRGVPQLVSAQTLIRFDGSFESEVSVPRVAFQPKPEERIEFSGMKLHATGQFPSSGAGKVSYTGSLGPVAFVANTAESTVSSEYSDVRISGWAELGRDSKSFLVPGAYEASMGDVHMHVAAANTASVSMPALDMRLTGFTSKQESKVDKDLWFVDTHARGKLNFNGFMIDNFAAACALRRLHIPGVEMLSSDWMRNGFSCDAAADPEHMEAAWKDMALKALNLLPYNPELECGPIAMELGGKRAELSYTVAMRDVTQDDIQPAAVPKLLEKLFFRMQAKAHRGLIDALAGVADKSLADSVAAGAGRIPADPAAPGGAPPSVNAFLAHQFIDGFVEEGYVVRDGDYISSSVESAGGELKVNGKPIDLPNLSELAELAAGADDEQAADEQASEERAPE